MIEKRKIPAEESGEKRQGKEIKRGRLEIRRRGERRRRRRRRKG